MDLEVQGLLNYKNVHMTGSSSLLQIHPENDYDQRGSSTIGPRIFIRNAPPITGSLSQQQVD